MNRLKNRPAWLRWKKRTGLSNQEAVTEPKKYPCYAYTSCLSFGYEELQEHYLYLEDINQMQRDLVFFRMDRKTAG